MPPLRKNGTLMDGPRARVSEIQRFSLEDGDGIRTTLFLQGCNLRCPWCHNPETLDARGALLAYGHLCLGCGRCRQACPEGLAQGGAATDRKPCRLCGRCAEACPAGALKFSGRPMTADEAFDAVARDREFYRESGGGVTLSGGEPLLQAAFCAALARRCQAEGIPVLVDTHGDVPFAAFEEVAPLVDGFLFDLKGAEPDYTALAGDGGRVYRNLARLPALARVMVRVPVIPGFNGTGAVMERLAGTLAGSGVERVFLLPFHRLGSAKYQALGLPYPYQDHEPVGRDRMAGFCDVFRRKGLDCVAKE